MVALTAGPAPTQTEKPQRTLFIRLSCAGLKAIDPRNPKVGNDKGNFHRLEKGGRFLEGGVQL
jgi:hypothetical protein